MGKKKILPFKTKWMDFEGIMLSEINQAKTNAARYHLYMEYKKRPNIWKQRVGKWWSAGMGKIGRVSQRDTNFWLQYK